MPIVGLPVRGGITAKVPRIADPEPAYIPYMHGNRCFVTPGIGICTNIQRSSSPGLKLDAGPSVYGTKVFPVHVAKADGHGSSSPGC